MSRTSHHVALFLPALPGGGAERTLLNLMTALADLGHRVDLVLAKAQGVLLDEVPTNIRLVDLQARRVLTSFFALRRYLQQERPDTLLSALHGNILALLASRILERPPRVVISERNMLTQRMAHYVPWRKRLRIWLTRLCYPWADEIIAVSKQVAADVADLSGLDLQQIRVIYNPVVTARLCEQCKESLDHPWFGLDQPPVIMAAGRLHPQKDFASLIKAFAAMTYYPDARLLILGEGSERTTLENLIKQHNLVYRVSLPGFVSNPYPYMQQADLFVLPSKWEGLPGVLIEALYCGTPIIATDCPGGSREILQDGAYGRLISVGDVPALTEAMETALSNPSPKPDERSWHRFQSAHIVDQYAQTLFDDKVHNP
ncbi:MAG: glycosyltransferase [Chloroflexota bacterium]